MTRRKAQKIVVDGGLRVNVWEVLERAVVSGATYGYHRAYKHTDTPTEDGVVEEIRIAIMNELHDVLFYDDPYDN